MGGGGLRPSRRVPVRVIYPLPAPRTPPWYKEDKILAGCNDPDNYTFYSNFTLPWNLITALLYLNIPLSLSSREMCYSKLVINRLILSPRHPHSAKLTRDMKPEIEKHQSNLFSAYLFKSFKIKTVDGCIVNVINSECMLQGVFLCSNGVLFPCLRKVV